MSLSRRVHSNGPPGADGCGVRPLARFMLAVLSAALLIASLPAPDIGWLGWVALVPLLISIDGLRPLRAAGLGLVTGILASFGIYGWLFEVPSFDMRHAVLLALYVGAYPAAWSATTAWLTGRHVPLIVAAPALWLVCDYLRAHAGFLALPWGTLAQTQHLNIALLQVAGFVGEHDPFQPVHFVVVELLSGVGPVFPLDMNSANNAESKTINYQTCLTQPGNQC